MNGTRTALAILACALAIGPADSEAAGDPNVLVRPAAKAASSVPASPAPEPEVARRRSGHDLLDQAWRGGGASLAERAKRTRAAALELGIWSLDPAARAILQDASLGSPLERAEAAALLAPELPDASFALARERLFGGSPRAALDSLLAAFSELARHPEASPWIRVALFDAAARVAIFAGLGFIAVAALGTLIALALPLGLRFDAPVPSAAALLAALLLLPAALGEGVLGIACAGAALALARGGIVYRVAILFALLLVFAGINPLGERRDRALASLSSDPVGEAVSGSERDFASSLDLVRLERAAPAESLARQALALQKRREGDLADAVLRFRALLHEGEVSADLLNNAANTLFAAGHAQEALALYERAVKEQPSSLVLFNLAQSYGRAILLEEQDLALAQAQALDPRAIHALTQHVAEVGSGGPVDVAVSAAELRQRAMPRTASRSWFSLRLAPGWLGSSRLGSLAGVALAVLGGAALAFPARQRTPGDDVYAGIARLLQRNKVMDPSVRMARLAALRLREARMVRLRRLAAWVVPGAAGIQGGHALLGLAACLLATAGLVAWRAGAGLLPDPFAAALTGAFAFRVAACAAALGYATTWLASLTLLRSRSAS